MQMFICKTFLLYFLQSNTKQKVFGFQNTRLILPWINLLQMDEFAKSQLLGQKWGWKVKLKVTGAQPGIFRGKTGFLVQKHFDKHFIHDIQKKGFAGKNFLVFSSRYS